MSSEVMEPLRDIVLESCRAMFAHYGVELSSCGDKPAQTGELESCGIIGFTSEQLRGTLVVAATSEPLARSKQAGESSRAWIAELSNQLLGRVKNRLLRLGIDIRSSTPLAMSGKHLQVVDHGDLSPAAFIGAGGHVLLWVDLELGPEWPKSAEDTDVADEGELLLF